MNKELLGYIPVNIANIIVSFGTIVILTRVLDGPEFGRYALTITAVYFLHMALFTWMEAAMARYYAEAERMAQVPTHLKTIYVTTLWVTGMALPLTIGLIFMSPLEETLKILFAFAFLTTCVHLLYNLGVESHKAAHRIQRYSVLHTSQSLLAFGIGVLVIILTPLQELGPFVGMIIATIVTLMVDLPFMLKNMRKTKVNKTRAIKYFRYGFPISMTLVLSYMLGQGDLFFIKYFLGDQSVGEYNAGYNLSNRSLDVIFIWMGMAVTPIAITTIEKKGFADAQNIMRDYGTKLLILVLPAATGIALVSKDASFILGESVREGAVEIMPWIALSGVLNGLITYYIHHAFYLSKNTKAMFIVMVLPVALNFALNFYLIPKFGVFGAVWATLIAYAVAVIVNYIIARQHFPLPVPWKSLCLCMVACAIMATTVVLLPLSGLNVDFIRLLIKASVGAIVYVGAVLLMNIGGSRDHLVKFVRKSYLVARISEPEK